jgi:two-component system, sporulation sensor kinase D
MILKGKLRLKHKYFKHILLYAVIVIIPSLLVSAWIFHNQYERLQNKVHEETKWLLTFHKNHIDRFIGETVAGLEMLAKFVNTEKYDGEKIQSILEKTEQQDQRFSWISLADSKGNVIVSSSQLTDQVNLLNKKYFQTTLITKQTTISEAYHDKITGNYIVTVATPVVNESGDVVSILLASLRLDYIKNIMNVLTPELYIQVTEGGNNILFETKEGFHKKLSPEVEINLEKINWKIKAKPDRIHSKQIIETVSIYILLTIIVSHIIFLLLKYYMLKRQTRLERIQNEAQKLELIGMLAAGTAHEIRNPLTGIKGLIQLLREKYHDEKDLFYFSVIEKEIQRINEIVNEFLVLGKPTVTKYEIHDINEILQELHPLIYSEANLHHVHYVNQLNPEPLFVTCTKDHFKQVVLNLTKNAVESMEPGGILTITTSKLMDQCKIVITDTGSGIPEELLDKIFQPFFTMKKSGTGLGLVICQRILKMYNGTIHIKSKVNKGTNVEILLPLQQNKMKKVDIS